MIRLVEMEGKMNEKGCIEIPAAVLEQSGIRTGETVKLIYLAEEESLKNESREFVLIKGGQDAEGEQDAAFRIPQELLKDAGIPADADLDIVCQDHRIIILPAETVTEAEIPKELLMLCDELGISRDKVKIILRATEENA